MSVKIDNNIILESALHVAERDGFINLVRSTIAEHAKCSQGKVNMAFGTMTKLKRAVMRQAIHKQILSVIADGILLKMACCMKLDQELRERAINNIIHG